MQTDKYALEPSPAKTFDTYKRLISLAIAERDLHTDMKQSFRLCIPHRYIPALSMHFPTYNYTVIGGCFYDNQQVYVTWQPDVARKNH